MCIVSCRQTVCPVSNLAVCALSASVFFFLFSLLNHSWERERELREGQTEKDKVCFCGRRNTYKVRREHSAQTPATSKNTSSTLEDRSEDTDENVSHGCRNTESTGRQTLKKSLCLFPAKVSQMEARSANNTSTEWGNKQQMASRERFCTNRQRGWEQRSAGTRFQGAAVTLTFRLEEVRRRRRKMRVNRCTPN